MENKKTITLEQKIDAWRRQYGNIYSIEVDGKICYLKQPDRRTLSAAAVIGQKDPLRYNEIILENCWIEGDEEIKSNDALFLGVSAKIPDLIEVREATLKKL